MKIVGADLLKGICQGDPEWVAINDRLHAGVKDFEARVWFKGLQELVRASKFSGMSGGHKTRYDQLMGRTPVSLLTFCTAGRCMIQVGRGNAFVSMVADETSPDPRTGLQSLGNVTVDEALELLDDAAIQWEAGDGRPVDDKHVGFG